MKTATGHEIRASVGLVACLDALEPEWRLWRQAAEAHNKTGARRRRGVGLACMWYGIGNTSMSNPSTMRGALAADGTLTLYSGAVDIGQGSNTIMTQIFADAVGLPAASVRLVAGDTDLTDDAGKTSASRQTFVSGNAARLAGLDLRAKLLRLANAGPDAAIRVENGMAIVGERTIDLAALPKDGRGNVLEGVGTFDPPTTPLDADGQGVPYATYAFAAQMAEIDVDPELGTVKVLRMRAAHDVGKAVNPIQVEGQIHGGIAQGLGLDRCPAPRGTHFRKWTWQRGNQNPW